MNEQSEERRETCASLSTHFDEPHEVVGFLVVESPEGRSAG